MCQASGSVTATFGTSPLRAMVRRTPCSSTSVTQKVRNPEQSATDDGTRRGRDDYSLRRLGRIGRRRKSARISASATRHHEPALDRRDRQAATDPLEVTACGVAGGAARALEIRLARSRVADDGDRNWHAASTGDRRPPRPAAQAIGNTPTNRPRRRRASRSSACGARAGRPPETREAAARRRSRLPSATSSSRWRPPVHLGHPGRDKRCSSASAPRGRAESRRGREAEAAHPGPDRRVPDRRLAARAPARREADGESTEQRGERERSHRG